MIAQHQTTSEKSTIVRSNTGAQQRPFGLRNDSARLLRAWGGGERRWSAARTDRQSVGKSTTDAGRPERLVTGLLTLIAAGYAIAVLIRIVALYA